MRMPRSFCPITVAWTLSLLVVAAIHLAYKQMLLNGYKYKTSTTITTSSSSIHDSKIPSVRGNDLRNQFPEAKEETEPSSIIRLVCPNDGFEKAKNIVNEHKSWYNQHSQAIVSNVTAFLDVFRNSEYDHWGKSYEEVKKGMYAWKKKRFSQLKSGAMIYESACGIGLNLFMTLEILNEAKGVQNITVYGNDYVPESIRIAESIGKSGLLPGNGRLGGYCASDSSRLSFVPSEAFDLVFTGYITPLLNPLLLDDSLTTNEKFGQYVAVCQSNPEQRQAAQERQNDWYAKWVGEMIRIAKPGAPIIVEQVSNQFCDAIFDWGGVAPEFWKTAVEKYGWDVDADSIRMEDDAIFRRRYHVFLRKNKA